MIKYIEREKAIEAAFSADGLGNSTFRDVHDVVDRLRLIPAADVREVRHGRWIQHTDTRFGPKLNDCIECSWCKIWYSSENQIHRNYCPNCGAKMDGGVNDDER